MTKQIQRGIVSVRAESEIKGLIEEVNTAFNQFKASNSAKIEDLRSELKKTQDAVDEAAVQAAAHTMNTGEAIKSAEPAVYAAAGMTRDELRQHYQAASTSRDKDLSLAEIVRGIAGMKTTDRAMAALSGGADSSGGFALPSVVMPRILDAMAEQSAILRAGARVLPLEQGAKSTTIAAVDTLPAPAWRQELGAVAESDPTFRGVALVPKSLACIVRVSRELIADSPDFDRALRTAIGAAVAAEIDRVALVGSGTDPEPLGIFGTVGINTGTQAGATFAWGDVLAAAQKIAEAKGPKPTSMIISPRTHTGLASLADTTGQWLGAPPLLGQLNTIATVGVPNNLGEDEDESLAFLGDFASVVLALRENMSVQRLVEAYAKTGEIALLIHSRIDIGVQYPGALAVVSGVK